MSEIEQRLSQVGIVLPVPLTPLAAYIPSTLIGSACYISGQLSTDQSGGIKGIVGDDLSLEDGQRAAQLCGINLIAQMKAACAGDFDRLKRIAKLNGFVQAGGDFFDIPAVMNGCSELMVKIFGERGKHARSAIGVYRIPFGYAVEVDAIIEVR
jgi:enamine deaminase RidA (YjgF/YER057c/UK114 family)